MKIVKFIVFLALIAAAALMGAAGALVYFNRPPESPADPDLTGPAAEQPGAGFFRISRGQNLTEIAANLEDQGFVRSKEAFAFYGRLRNTAGQMKTGYYRIEPGSSMLEIHDLLLSGAQVLYRVTVPEGWTVRQIARKMEEEGICSGEDFLAAAGDPEVLARAGIPGVTAEGFLYPDTYHFPQEFPASRVIAAMTENFFSVLEGVTPDFRQKDPREVYDRIILASIVEREYRVADEAPLMAGVFYNRLRDNIPLGSCATVVYIITSIQGKPHPQRIYHRDLEIPSEYNTYIHPGLPPAPISNPGFTSLDAAFHPEESDYYYFLLQDANAGRHVFSRTYSQHINNYDLYIKGY